MWPENKFKYVSGSGQFQFLNAMGATLAAFWKIMESGTSLMQMMIDYLMQSWSSAVLLALTQSAFETVTDERQI